MRDTLLEGEVLQGRRSRHLHQGKEIRQRGAAQEGLPLVHRRRHQAGDGTPSALLPVAAEVPVPARVEGSRSDSEVIDLMGDDALNAMIAKSEARLQAARVGVAAAAVAAHGGVPSDDTLLLRRWRRQRKRRWRRR